MTKHDTKANCNNPKERNKIEKTQNFDTNVKNLNWENAKRKTVFLALNKQKRKGIYFYQNRKKKHKQHYKYITKAKVNQKTKARKLKIHLKQIFI